MTIDDRFVIEPELFKYVTEFSDSIAAGDVSTSDPIRKRHRLYVFTENFLAQFAERYLRRDIQGFNSRSHSDLVEARRELEADEGAVEGVRLIFALEPLGSRLSELTYSDSREDIEEFLLYAFPRLLSRIVAWLEENEADEELLEAATRARDEYDRTVGIAKA